MSAVFSVLGAVLLVLLKVLLVLLAILLVLVAVLLLCPFCADISWQGGVFTLRAGMLGITFPVLRLPKPEPPAEPAPPKGVLGRLKARFAAWRARRKAEKAARKPPKQPKPKKKAEPGKKAKITLNILCTILRGAGRLIRAVFGALRFTRIRVQLGVRGGDPAAAARTYGTLNAWLYPTLGVLDRFLYLDFEELRILPDFNPVQHNVEDRVSFRVSARLLFIVIAAVRVLYEFWREKVLDLFL